ncbi:MAG: holo-ACP synthase [Planctomycetaceae bacterium]|jgi:holo-[acyl-carrier protein] synthase|nr:holo-ACP synthase [Planctomycetaceae bacterium]
MQIIGIGTDIADCKRIARMLEKHPKSFRRHVFTDNELAYCDSGKSSLTHFTGRWAAKEAILKALGTGWTSGITWRDVEITNEPSGRPIVKLTGGAKTIADTKNITEIKVTISHCPDYAVAFAVATGE